ncbi:MAG: hypothetical protein ABMA64_42920 [Myxococcota bacterium]
MSAIYVASLWRNPSQPALVGALRADGHCVYDFRQPSPTDHGFGWSEIDPSTNELRDWLRWPHATPARRAP